MKACSIAGCPNVHFARGWCNTHYYRWRRHGDPLTVHNHLGLSAFHRVLLQSVQDGDCRVFTGRRRNGYGQISDGGRKRDAHRVVLEHHQGPSPLNVLHSCDNKACVEIAHLRYGTQAENINDMIERGRGWWQVYPT